MEEEFHALFSGTRFPSLPLWESCYRPDGKREGRLLNGVTRDVALRYREAGLRVDESVRQPPDHIGVECAFFARTLGVDEERALSFFDGHLGAFAEAFGAALEERARLEPYRLLARLLRVSSARPCLRRGWGQSPSERSSSKRSPERERPFLRPLAPHETAAEKLVPICGINNCGGRCPLTAVVADGCVLELRPAIMPASGPKITPCARGFSYHRTFLSGERLRYPLRRVGKRGEARFERISWDGATDIVAEEISRAGRRYGPQSRYVNYGYGVSGVASGRNLARNLLALDGGFLDGYNSYSTACTAFTTPYTYGTGETGNDAEDLLNSKLIVLWGHNPFETRFGADLSRCLREAKRRGIEIVAVDPRLSDTATSLAARWIGIRPTTDSALMDGMAHTIFSEGLEDREFMDRFCLGFDAAHMPEGMEGRENYRDYVFGKYDGTPKTAAWASAVTGADEGDVLWLARRYATAKPAALLQGYGPQRNGNGEQTVRSGTMLACLTGNVGVPGGSACGYGQVRPFGAPAIPLVPNPYRGQIPTFLWTDAILRGAEMTAARDGVLGAEKLDVGIKLVVNAAGSVLLNQHSDIGRTSAILRDESLCEFIVCSDLFLTPGARFADVLLPGTSLFEGENIGTPWREGDALLYCSQAVEPLFECRFEYDWMADVARKLGHGDAFTHGGKSLRELLRESWDKLRETKKGLPDFDAFRARGIHRWERRKPFVAFEENIRDPERHPFPTPSGKIEIFSPRLAARGNPSEIPAIPKYVPSFEGPEDPLASKYPFQLVGWHTKRRTHSVHDNNPDMEFLEPQRLWIHPEDAGSRGVGEGDWVEVFNDRGRTRMRARVTERVVRGVLAAPQGAWYSPEGGIDVRGCVNTITTARPTPLAKGNPQHSNLVDIVRVNPAPPRPASGADERTGTSVLF
jgi:anaerobic dimethyl sulfoxide reductase subunit A